MALATPTNLAIPQSKSMAGSGLRGLTRRPEVGSLVGLVAVFLFFAVFGGKQFVSASGVASWLNVAAEVGMVALPVGILMIAGKLDLSIGAVIPASSLTLAVISGYYKVPIILGIAAALAMSLAVGLINGVLVLRTRVPSLIVTIGTMFAVMGLTLGLSVLLTGATSTALVPTPLFKALLGQFVGGMFEIAIFWWVAFTVILAFVLHVSPYGNWIFALGGDEQSARNAGIPTDGLTVALFMISSFSAGFLGICQVMTYQSAQVAGGQSFIFNSIMCVVMGGVLLTGGFGSIVGIVFGTITFSIVNQGIYYTPFDPNLGSVIIGALLLVAVLTNDTFRHLALSAIGKKKAVRAGK